MKITATTLLLYSLFLCGCFKPTEHLGTDRQYACHTGRNLDSASLAAKLVGNWKFNRWECQDFTSIQDADRDSKINFKPDGFFVFDDNGGITTGTWKLVVGSEGYKYSMSTDPVLGHFKGKIILCQDDVAIFNGACHMEYVRF